MDALYHILETDYSKKTRKESKDDWILSEYISKKNIDTNSFDSLVYACGLLDRIEEKKLLSLMLQRYGEKYSGKAAQP